VTALSVLIRWTRSADSGLDHYNIYRDNVLIGTCGIQTTAEGGNSLDPNVHFGDFTSITSASTYVYKVTAVDTSGNESVKSSGLSVTIPGAAVSAPTTPTNL